MKEKEKKRKKRICYFINDMNQLLREREKKRRDLHITSSLFFNKKKIICIYIYFRRSGYMRRIIQFSITRVLLFLRKKRKERKVL